MKSYDVCFKLSELVTRIFYSSIDEVTYRVLRKFQGARIKVDNDRLLLYCEKESKPANELDLFIVRYLVPSSSLKYS